PFTFQDRILMDGIFPPKMRVIAIRLIPCDCISIVRKICPHEESCDSASKDIKISKASWRWDSCRKHRLGTEDEQILGTRVHPNNQGSG
ncbi:hypothetical protein, partial [Methanosaeta sp. UBA356]|uniref:hypothetical protein n=1 Tax=Methanosaeta sp. UBA356 TaxID=1915559 RepID=UPI00257FE0B1